MKTLIFWLLVSVVSTCNLSADVYGESGINRSLTNIIESYVIYRDGKVPKSWEEVFQAEGLDTAAFRRGYLKNRGERLEDKYVFVNEELEIPHGVGKALIVLMRVNPINLDNRSYDHRLFVYLRDGRGGIGSLPETEAEKMFANAGKQIPGKGSQADRESRVDGKIQYVAAAPTPKPKPDNSPLQTSQSQAPSASPHSQPPSTIADKSSSRILIFAIVLMGLFAGAAIFFRKKMRQP